MNSTGVSQRQCGHWARSACSHLPWQRLPVAIRSRFQHRIVLDAQRSCVRHNGKTKITQPCALKLTIRSSLIILILHLANSPTVIHKICLTLRGADSRSSSCVYRQQVTQTRTKKLLLLNISFRFLISCAKHMQA